MISRLFSIISALTLAFVLTTGLAQAENIGGRDLVAFMKAKPSFHFQAGSVANFAGKSGNSGIGGFTMKHKGSAALKGTYTVSLNGWVDMVFKDGSRQRFTVERVSKTGTYQYKLTYTKGPYRGRSFLFR